MRPNGLEDGLFARLSGGPRPTCFILHTSVVSEPFDTVERVQLFGGPRPTVAPNRRWVTRPTARSKATLTASGTETR